MIRFTTLFHLGARVLLIVCAFVVWGLLNYLADALAPFVGILQEYGTIASGISAIIIMVIVAGRYEATLDALAAYFYVREDLKTPISFVEAKKLSFLFAGDSKGKWYPLEEVAKMPNEQRKPYLFRFADRVARGELPKG